MRRRVKLLWVLAALLLTGCSLARPEAGRQGEDPWVGFYVVPTLGHADRFHDNPYVERYGTAQMEAAGLGPVDFPREVLLAVEDGPDRWIFPGMEGGYSLFLLRTPLPPEERAGSERLDMCVSVVSNMAPGQGLSISSSDQGESSAVSGVIYYGPPLDAGDWDPYGSGIVWDIYRVYQTADGRPYLDGSCSSVGGPMTYTDEQTVTRTADGRQYRDVLTVSVTVAAAPRLERLVVTQFGADNVPLRSEELTLREPLPEVCWEAGAAWALVEEESAEGTVRTVYSVPGAEEEAVSHQIILLDGQGLGRVSYLSIS